MTFRAKQLVANLREHAEWAQANEWETPITLSDDLRAAANTIAELSAKLESKEEKLAAMNLDLVAENEQLKAEIGFGGHEPRRQSGIWKPFARAIAVSIIARSLQKAAESVIPCATRSASERPNGRGAGRARRMEASSRELHGFFERKGRRRTEKRVRVRPGKAQSRAEAPSGGRGLLGASRRQAGAVRVLRHG